MTATWMATALLAMPARATEPMAAEVLFDEGVEDMKAERFPQACPKIAESHRLERRAGTLFTLAECWARAARPATALARYREYLRLFERMSDADKAAQRGRDAVAAAQIERLEAEVAKLRVVLLEPVPAGTTIKHNDRELGRPSLGTWLPLDPGEHVLVAQAPGGPATTLRVDLVKGERRAVELMVQPAVPTAPVRPPKPATALPLPRQGGAADREGLNQLEIGAVATGALAFAGLLVGTVAGIAVLGQKEDLDRLCGIGGDPTACTPEGKREADAAQALASLSTVGFVVAGAATFVSIALVVVDQSTSAAGGRSRVPFATLALGVSGRW